MTTTIFASADKNIIKEKKILLVDNIRTTGATASEIARVLKKAKTNIVNVLTLCHKMPLKVINNKKNYFQIVLFFGKIELLFSQKKD